MKLYLLVTQVAWLFQVANAGKNCDYGNDLQRCFTRSLSPASAYCSSYLSIPVVTITTTPSAFIRVPSIASVETDVVISTITSTFYSTGIATTVETTFTTTITTAPAPLAKRATSNFDCITSKTRGPVLYAPASISSACSCLGLARKTVVHTAGTSTKTSYSQITETTSTTSTLQVPTTVITSITTTSTETDIVTSVTTLVATSSSTSVAASSTTSVSAPPATCSPGPLVANGNGVSYSQFFVGSGVSEDPNNPSNDGPTSPSATTFPATMTGCDAAVACASFAWNAPGGDYSFDLHFLIAENEWECVAYYDNVSSASDFDIVDSNVGVAYGYQI